MRILIVTETLTFGGAETFVVRLANALCAEHQVCVAVMHGERIHLSLLRHLAPSVVVERLHLPAKRSWFRLDSLVRKLRVDWSPLRLVQRRWLKRVTKRFRPDVLHSHLLKADRLVAETRESDTPQLITLHGDYAPFLVGQADPQMLGLEERMQMVIAQTNAIVAICDEQLAFINERFPSAITKTSLIHNGFSPWRSIIKIDAKNTETAVNFGMVSRGVKLKGWAKAIEAFASLPPDTATLTLVGEGPYLDEVKHGPIPNGVKFVGFSDNPVDWITDFDVCLLPSEFPYESLPTAVMEYLFCGKPVIATDVGEISAMLRDTDGNLAGMLLEFDGRKISTTDLTAAMKAYVDDPALRRRHAALAPAAFAKFDMGKCATAYARLYAEVAAGDSSNSLTSASH